jgi:hypothetical protein
MGIAEDREDFNSTGLRGVLQKAMRERDEAFIRVLEGGWHGELLNGRPEPGSGPYLHFRRGHPVLQYSNSTPTDENVSEYRSIL